MSPWTNCSEPDRTWRYPVGRDIIERAAALRPPGSSSRALRRSRVRPARLLPRGRRGRPRLPLQVCTVFDETAQDELLGADGDFRAASTVAPVGVARPDGPDHVVLDGTWPYSSGAPCSTHYVGQTLRAGDPPGPPVLFVAPRSV
ncbi:acyl-CoA dehydrogenase family protein [Streptomyces pseudovenezuelae]|uniref:hypothetical protein n=1 Tax=Streptomyces pseudovenezuelae TaxID=67350 RepID=UPI00372411AF